MDVDSNKQKKKVRFNEDVQVKDVERYINQDEELEEKEERKEQRMGIFQSFLNLLKAFKDWIVDLFTGQNGEKRWKKFECMAKDFVQQYDNLPENSYIKKDIDQWIDDFDYSISSDLDHSKNELLYGAIMKVGRSGQDAAEEVKSFKETFFAVPRSEQKQFIVEYEDFINSLEKDIADEKADQPKSSIKSVDLTGLPPARAQG